MNEGGKKAEVLWCLFLTDEGCPLLTLSGKLETGVERLKPEYNGDFKLWGEINASILSYNHISGKQVPKIIWTKEGLGLEIQVANIH